MSESPLIDDEPTSKKHRIDENGEVDRNDDIEMNADEPTILECLNSDVLRIIFGELSTADILGSVAVSRKWRNAILEYLKGSHYCFEHYYLHRLHFVPRLLGLININDGRGSRSTPFDMSHGDLSNLKTKITELGPGIVKIILDCLNENILKTIVQNCPNLRELMVVGMTREHPAHDAIGQNGTQQCELLSFNEEVRQCLKELQLKRVMFIECKAVTDDYIREFLKGDSIEELILARCSSVEGDCLSCLSQNKENKLKSLRIVACGLEFLEPEVIDNLTELTTLDLSNHSLDLLGYVPRLLNKTSNLECLVLNCYPYSDVADEIVECFERLPRLRHLSLCWNDNVDDEWLEAVAEGCPGLQTLDIETKTYYAMNSGCVAASGFRADRRTVTAAGVLALCRAAPQLEHLGVAGNADVSDATVAAVARACPKLESMDLRGCARIAQNLDVLRALAAPARAAGPLRLRLARTAADRSQFQTPPQGVIFDFVDAPRLFKLV
ncbi:dynein regulatory complex subunit 6-like isoform X2 [Leguminivora glycinivorella]|uniref:dynein regulatory complex subunit 6-like isoform X2 n=2 Tax=Leguminivora glycinivorella TaxID=1035111 RepID=UPI00200EB11C|nr:dynein regulatory complex subunit 6-like isoform X2 [Leguminivora glycinivorella]